MGKETIDEAVERLRKELRCNCDLDSWVPQPDTGHSVVCRIDKAVRKMVRKNQIKFADTEV